jgi:hypothetical protein
MLTTKTSKVSNENPWLYPAELWRQPRRGSVHGQKESLHFGTHTKVVFASPDGDLLSWLVTL